MCIRDSACAYESERSAAVRNKIGSLSKAGSKRGRTERVEAVSYTHLDVYKRQFQVFGQL